jgi:citrate synthase
VTVSDFIPGLQGVVAAETHLSSVDGQLGELIIAGFPLEEIAGWATFEEMVYLLWHDRLPNANELADFRQALAAYRAVSASTIDLLREAATQVVEPMDALRMAASMISLRTVGEPDADNRDALALVARFPTIVAAYWHLLHGQEPIAPNPGLSHAANYLYMLTGEVPGDDRTRALETYLNTVVDHGLNASTFTARVIISTGSDLVSAIVGALKGPLHGGAPGPALDMVFEIGEAANAESVLRAKLDQGERLMGFGHRIYKVRDPRADVLSQASEKLYRADGDMQLYNLVQHVEKTAVALLEEYKPGRKLQTNVEFYTALLLHGLNLPTDLFSPTFAISRCAGWIAHAMEQETAGRIIRPQSTYIGEYNRTWIPIAER